MRNSGTLVKRILVVEDEPGISQVCLRVLVNVGFDVDIAVNGDIAQEMLTKKAYDLCLIDIRTPIMNGEQLYQVISTKHPDLGRGVIFTTGDVMDNDTGNFLSVTGRPFLPKPFTPDELGGMVSEVVKRLEQ